MGNSPLADLLAERTPVAVVEQQWMRPIRLSSFLGDPGVADELVGGVRCVVQVEAGIVVCTDVKGNVDVLPGGRREPGETPSQTICREVHEETGWALDANSLETLGFIVLTNLGEPQPPWPYPHALHLVMAGRADTCAGDDWTDTEGFVVSSQVMSIDDVDPTTISAHSWAFVDELVRQRQLGVAPPP
jgi:8-oxo-dGTP pyrophosphatase MutT (NUDIX family)